MSKFVKELVTTHLKTRLGGVDELILVNMVGLSANASANLRKELRSRNINVMVVKNSLARRAAEGTELAPAFQTAQGALALVWGATDIVALAKEIIRLASEKQYASFEARGGVMGGSALTADEVKAVSKWPSREEQLSLLMGQILAPGAMLVSQLTSMGGALASQIKQHAEGEGGAAEGDPAAPAAEGAAEAS